VGDLLPQEEFLREGSGVTEFNLAFAQDKPNRIGPQVGSVLLPCAQAEL